MNAQEKLLERVEEEIKFLFRWDGPDDCRQTKLLSDLREEIQRLDRHMEVIANASHTGDGTTAIAVNSKFYTCQQYARTHRFEDE